jgi:hypothetical protein
VRRNGSGQVGLNRDALLRAGYTELPTHQSKPPASPDPAAAAAAAAKVEEEAARGNKGGFYVFTMPFAWFDRPKAEGETAGFVRVYVGTRGCILGATVVGESKRRADESPWSQFTSQCQRLGHPPRLDK